MCNSEDEYSMHTNINMHILNMFAERNRMKVKKKLKMSKFT